MGQQKGGVLRAWLRSQPRILRELEAGALAGGLGKTCVAPLERTKILFQTRRVPKEMGIPGTLKFLWETEGLGGLFRGNTVSVLRIMPYAAIHFSVYEHYRRIIKEFILPEENKQQHGQQPDGSRDQAGSLGSKEQEAAAAVARVLRPQHPQAGKITDSSARRTAEDRAQAVAAVVDQVMEESSSSGSSIDVTAAMVAAQAQLEARKLPGTPPATQPPPSSKPAPLHPIWDLVAGSMSGATAVMITYPLDLVRTRLAYATESALSSESNNKVQAQTQSDIVSSSSNRRGSDTPRCSGECSNSGQRHSHHHNPRPHQHHHHSISSLLRTAAKSEGLRGLYMGVTPTLMGILPYAGLKFYVYQSLKHAYNRKRASSSSSSSGGGNEEGSAGQNDAGVAQKKLPISVMLLFGGTAGLFAQTLTYPLDIVRRRMQVEGIGSLGGNVGAQTAASRASTAAPTRPKHHTTLSIARTIVAEDGLRGLFRGLSINYLKVVPSTAIGFTAYEHLKHYLDVVGNL